MDTILNKHHKTLYALLVAALFAFLPLAGTASPQQSDITKPTRERVKNNKDVKKDEKKDTKKDTKKDAKKDDKAAQNKSAKNKAADNKAATNKANDNKAATNKANDNKAAINKANDNKETDKKTDDKKPQDKANTPDTAGKAAAAPAPKPKPQPVNPDNVQFDGIDVSKHQGRINWEELSKQTKIKFVYIKATEGGDVVDNWYAENIRQARKHGFKVGSYHFFFPKSSAMAQFKNFIKTAKREDQDLIPVIDVEKIGKWSSQQLRDSVKAFADLLEDYYGCKPIIYTFETFYNKHLGKSFDGYPLFIAKFSSTPPNINGIKWVIWQFSESGRFKAVKDNLVDMSRFNKGCSLSDITYVPSKHKPRTGSVKDAVDHKEKPSTVNMTEQKGASSKAPGKSAKQIEEEKRQAEKERRVQERKKKIDEENAKKKEKEKAAAQKKEKEKAEQAKRKQQREAAAQKEAEDKAKRKAAAQKEAEEKAKRKAAAQKAREEQKAKQQKSSSNKSTSLLQTSSSKLTQTQRNDSIRAAKQKGRKTNKSSADND